MKDTMKNLMDNAMNVVADNALPKMEYVDGELLYQAGTVPDEERLKLISLIISEMDDPNVSGCISDGYHTFDDLYYQRMILTKTVALAAINKFDEDTVYRSWLHSDGTMYKNYFIVVFKTPEGNFSYHYPMYYWDSFDFLKELPNAEEFDGHTWKDVTRLHSLFNGRMHYGLTGYLI